MQTKEERKIKKAASDKAYYEIHKREITEYAKEWNTKNKESPSRLYSSYKGCSKHRDYLFELTLEEFMLYWQKPCTYCGIEIKTVGIDRINSSIGYKIDNCVPCCTRCNFVKSNHSIEETNQHLIRMLKHQGFI
jgi:hypothetical protein